MLFATGQLAGARQRYTISSNRKIQRKLKTMKTFTKMDETAKQKERKKIRKLTCFNFQDLKKCLSNAHLNCYHAIKWTKNKQKFMVLYAFVINKAARSTGNMPSVLFHSNIQYNIVQSLLKKALNVLKDSACRFHISET